MFLKPYENKPGMKVWLEEPEVQRLLSTAEDTKQLVAFILGVRSGLRVGEIVEVTPADVVATSAGPRVRVRDGKGGKYRESPTTLDLYHIAHSAMDYSGIGPDVRLVGTQHPRTVRRWVERAAEKLCDETNEKGWSHLGPHDLRRTWATNLAGQEVDPLLVCDWGGWDDLDTFLEHYRGVYSPEIQRREIAKVEWLDTAVPGDKQQDPTTLLVDMQQSRDIEN